MKNLQNLFGVKTLNKKEQQSINGGSGGCNHLASCFSNNDCGPKSCTLICDNGKCRGY